jgi:hypothetical protein
LSKGENELVDTVVEFLEQRNYFAAQKLEIFRKSSAAGQIIVEERSSTRVGPANSPGWPDALSNGTTRMPGAALAGSESGQTLPACVSEQLELRRVIQ